MLDVLAATTFKPFTQLVTWHAFAMGFGDNPRTSPGGELSLSEPALVSRDSSGSLESRVSDLFTALRGRLYQYLLVVFANPAEAEDATQECFLRLYRYLYQGKPVDNPRVWIFRVAHNLALDRKKSGRFVREVAPPSWDEIFERYLDPSPSPEQGMIQRERYEAVRAVVNRLNDQQKQVLYLKAEGLDYREIGQIMSLSTTAIAAHVRRGIVKIKAEING